MKVVKRELASIECLPCVTSTLHTSHLIFTITREIGIIVLILSIKMILKEIKQGRNLIVSHGRGKSRMSDRLRVREPATSAVACCACTRSPMNVHVGKRRAGHLPLRECYLNQEKCVSFPLRLHVQT